MAELRRMSITFTGVASALNLTWLGRLIEVNGTTYRVIGVRWEDAYETEVPAEDWDADAFYRLTIDGEELPDHAATAVP